MKKWIIALLTAAMLLTCLSAAALAETYVRFSGNCNVRTGPGLGYTSIGSVNRGSTLSYNGSTRVDGRGVSWYSVNFGGRTGWVSSVYASLTSQGGNATYGAGGSYNDGDYYAEYDDHYSGEGSYVRSTSGDSHVRTGPGLGYTSIGVLYRGQSASYAGDTSVDNRGVAWYSIYWGGDIAWISSMYTSLVN